MPKLRIARIRPDVVVSIRARFELLAGLRAVRVDQRGDGVGPFEGVRIGRDSEALQLLEIRAALPNLFGFFLLLFDFRVVVHATACPSLQL